MISHDAMISAKVVMLERVVKDLLAAHFSETQDPIASAEQYAEQRRKPGPHTVDDPTLELACEEIWSEFLDDLLGQMRQAKGGL